MNHLREAGGAGRGGKCGARRAVVGCFRQALRSHARQCVGVHTVPPCRNVQPGHSLVDERHIAGAAHAAATQVEGAGRPQQRDARRRRVCSQGSGEGGGQRQYLSPTKQLALLQTGASAWCALATDGWHPALRPPRSPAAAGSAGPQPAHPCTAVLRRGRAPPPRAAPTRPPRHPPPRPPCRAWSRQTATGAGRTVG